MNRIPLNPGERLTDTGRTGSGKTTLIRHLVRERKQELCIILDTKGDEAFEYWPVDENVKIFNRLPDSLSEPWWVNRPWSIIVVRPRPDEAASPELLDDWLLNLTQNSQNILIVIDEAYMFHTGGQAGPGLVGLLTRGRSKRQTAIIGTQRPAWVSKFIYTECDHFCVLRLQHPDDRKALENYTGMDIPDLPFYEGLYFDSRGGRVSKLFVTPEDYRMDSIEVPA